MEKYGLGILDGMSVPAQVVLWVCFWPVLLAVVVLVFAYRVMNIVFKAVGAAFKWAETHSSAGD